VWNLGEWGSDEKELEGEDATRGVARWAAAVSTRTLGQDLVDAIRLRQGRRISEGRDRAALLEALARHPLLVAPWVADPEVRRQVALWPHTPNGRIVLDVVVPILCRFALRLAWDEVAVPLDESVPLGVAAHQVAAELHTRAMAHLVRFLAEVEPDSAVKLAAIRPADRERTLSAMLTLERVLGPGSCHRRAIMLGSTPGALRTWLWRRRRRTVTRPRRSIRAKSGS